MLQRKEKVEGADLASHDVHGSMLRSLVIVCCFSCLVSEEIVGRVLVLRGGLGDDVGDGSPMEFRYVQAPKIKKRPMEADSSSGLSELLKDVRPEEIPDIDDNMVDHLLQRHGVSSKTERRKEKRCSAEATCKP